MNVETYLLYLDYRAFAYRNNFRPLSYMDFLVQNLEVRNYPGV